MITCCEERKLFRHIHIAGFFFLVHTYGDLRSIPEFAEKTVLAIKAPPDTVLSCDAQEVRKETRACSRAVTGFFRYIGVLQCFAS